MKAQDIPRRIQSASDLPVFHLSSLDIQRQFPCGGGDGLVKLTYTAIAQGRYRAATCTRNTRTNTNPFPNTCTTTRTPPFMRVKYIGKRPSIESTT